MHVPEKQVIQKHAKPHYLIEFYLNIICELYFNIDLPNKYRDIYINW